MRRLLTENAVAQVALALVVILPLKWEIVTQPPVWDTAMGLFPAALTLAGNGFDLIELLGMPGYVAGGPNVHSTSPVTWLTALVLMISGGGVGSFVTLHLVHFTMAAVALAALYRFALPVLGEGAAALLCLSVLLQPVFLVQVGYMYMEIGLFLCTVMALLAWAENRFWPAVVWATLAFAVKEAGVIVPATLATAALLENRRLSARAWKVVGIASLPALWLGSMALLKAVAGAADLQRPEVPLGFVYSWLLHYLERFLFNVPDLLALFVAFLFAAALFGPELVRQLRGDTKDPAVPDSGRQERLRLTLSGILVLGFLALFLVALPLAIQFNIVLPRYTVIVLPFLLLWVGYVAERAGRRFAGDVRHPAILTFVLLSVFFALNRDGRWYPSDIDTEGPGNDFALTERSHAYLRLNGIQREAMAFLETLPEWAAVYYGHYEHYLLQYPGMGYASGPLSNGHSLSLTSLPDLTSSADLAGEPSPFDCFYVLYNYPWLGGDEMLELFDLVDAEPALSREVVQEFRDGRYAITLSRVRPTESTCARTPGGDV